MSNKWRMLALIALICGCDWICPGPAFAADTTEPFDKGAVDAELYVGVANPDSLQGRAATDLVLGYGLTQRLSLMVGARFEQALREDTKSSHVHLGGLLNLIDSVHVDLDLLFCGHVGGEGFASWQLVPGLELNLDSDPQRRGVGLYLRAGVALGSHPEAATDTHRVLLAWELALTAGAYWSMAENHQVLVEADAGVLALSESARRFDFGGLAFGYNVTIASWLELINQLHVDLPQGEERVGYAVTTGLIMTL